MSNDRSLYFDPISGEMRFDIDYQMPDNIPNSISWPMNLQRHNKKYGFKNLTLALTMNCNLACDYCWQCHGKIPDMEKETIDYWLDFFLDGENNSPNKILYYGGEPLLRIDLIEYASQRMRQICKERNLQAVNQHIFTNATLLNDRVLDILQREEVFLVLSVDGNREINSLHRHTIQGEDVMDEILLGVKRLHERGMKFGVCCTLSSADFDVDSTVKYILETLHPHSIELNLRHDRQFCAEAERFKDQRLDSFFEAWDLIRQHNTLNIDLRKRVSAIAARIPLQNSSSGSKNKLSVMPDGKISSFNGAVSYPELQIEPSGDWISEFQKRWDRNVLCQSKCEHCRAAYICGQGSAFSSYLQYGDFEHTPALHCEYCKTILDYVLDTIKKVLISKKDIPYGYVVTYEDICTVFPAL